MSPHDAAPRVSRPRHAALCALLFAALPALAQTPPAGTPPRDAAAAAAAARFDVFEYVVEGNTVLSTELIERAVYPFLGPQRTVEDVENARSALELVYRNAGFATVGVDIPEQRVTEGVVRLRVVGGEVSRLRVVGSRYYSQGYILARVPALAEGTVPNLRELQEQLVEVNRTADRRVTPLLRPGKRPGTTEVDLTVEDRLPLHGNLEINNRASANTSETRLAGGLRYENLWQLDHGLAVQFQLSPERTREVKVLLATYTVPLGGDSLAFSVIRSDSEVAAGVGDTTVFGKGTIWGVRRNVVTELREGAYQAVNVGLDYKDFSETVEIGAGAGAGFSTPLRYLPLSAGYVGLFDDASGRWQFGTSFIAALRGLVGQEQQFADKRYLASSSFGLVKFDVSREQKLGTGLSLYVRLDGQLTDAPLVSNEQFVAGGVDSVRGYYESAAVGDIGLRGTMELRSANLAGADWPGVRSLSVQAFYDGAYLKVLKPLPAQADRFALDGFGVGLRAAFKPYGSLSLAVASPLRSLGPTVRGRVRWHAAGSIEF